MFSLFQEPLVQSPRDHFLSVDWSVEVKYILTYKKKPHCIYSSCCQWQHLSTQNLLFQVVDQSTLYHTATENQKHTMCMRSATSTQYLRAGSVLVSVGTFVTHSVWLSHTHTHKLCLGEWLPVNKSIRLWVARMTLVPCVFKKYSMCQRRFSRGTIYYISIIIN